MPTLEQIEEDLPNGFHDAEIFRIQVDFEQGEAILELNLLVSTPDSEVEGEYRRGSLFLRSVVFMSIDPPGQKTPLLRSEPLWVVAGPGQPSTSPIELPLLPADCFLHWFFVKEWNGFIRVAAKDAEFHWKDS